MDLGRWRCRQVGDELAERSRRAPRGGRQARSHVGAGSRSAQALTASRRRRLMRLRSGALPVFLVTVNPMPGSSILAVDRLQPKSRAPGAIAPGGPQELAPLGQAPQRGLGRGMAVMQAARLRPTSFLRPAARRRLRILRPFLVAMRARKPWRRVRTSLLGWNVRFITSDHAGRGSSLFWLAQDDAPADGSHTVPRQVGRAYRELRHSSQRDRAAAAASAERDRRRCAHGCPAYRRRRAR